MEQEQRRLKHEVHMCQETIWHSKQNQAAPSAASRPDQVRACRACALSPRGLTRPALASDEVREGRAQLAHLFAGDLG